VIEVNADKTLVTPINSWKPC